MSIQPAVRRKSRWMRLGGTLLAVLVGVTAAPAVAAAHGPVAPVATSYLARIHGTPPGMQAKIVDGYVRIWLQVPANESVVVLDYRGAPYLRFSRSGVQVNQNSEMFYLNQTPVAAAPPAALSSTTPPRWQSVSGGHADEWHDGRLQALASIALAPGTSYVGRWSIPLRVNGRAAAITGGLWHHRRPSPVWFWPIAVILLCALAARRLHRPALDARLAQLLGLTALAAAVTAGTGLGLHGRPTIPVLHLVELAALLAFAGWATRHVLWRPPEWFAYFAIAAVAIWEGVNLTPTLLNAFVLISLPATVARITAVLCLGAGISLLPLLPRLPAHTDQPDPSDQEPTLDEIMGSAKLS
jgi:hypothetical protein